MSAPAEIPVAIQLRLYAKDVWKQVTQRTCFGHLFNRKAISYADSLIGKEYGKGNTYVISGVGALTGKPLIGGQVLKNNEEGLDLTSFTMSMDSMRIGVRVQGKETVEQNSTVIDLMDTATERLAKRAADLFDTATFYVLAGSAPTTLTLDGATYGVNDPAFPAIRGFNTITPPTAGRIVRPNNKTTDEALTPSDTMSLELIDRAVGKARIGNDVMEMFPDNTFDLYISEEQAFSLRTSAADKITWQSIQLAQLSGGRNALFDNEYTSGRVTAGQYRNVRIYVAPRVAIGVNSSTSAGLVDVRRAVMVGPDAAKFGSKFGGRPTDGASVPIIFKKEEDDYETIIGYEARAIYGLKKFTMANKEDNGVMVLSTWAGSL